MKKMKETFFIGIAAISLPILAVGEMELPMGWYLEGNMGRSKISGVSYAPATTLNANGVGWNITAGYKFIPYFAAEFGYTSYANAMIKSMGTQIARDRTQAYDIAGKAILPMQDNGLDIFAKLGAARAKSRATVTNPTAAANNNVNINNSNSSSTALYLGAGGDYFFTPNIASNIQWTRVNGNSRTGDLDLFSIGVSYLFD
jgi:hypothetical protein